MLEEPVSQLEAIYQAVLDGNAAAAQAGVKAAIAEGTAPEVILKEGLISAMGEVGRLFEENEYFVPEMLVSARAMQVGPGPAQAASWPTPALPRPARSSSAPSRATCTTSARTWSP